MYFVDCFRHATFISFFFFLNCMPTVFLYWLFFFKSVIHSSSINALSWWRLCWNHSLSHRVQFGNTSWIWRRAQCARVYTSAQFQVTSPSTGVLFERLEETRVHWGNSYGHWENMRDRLHAERNPSSESNQGPWSHKQRYPRHPNVNPIQIRVK